MEAKMRIRIESLGAGVCAVLLAAGCGTDTGSEAERAATGELAVAEHILVEDAWVRAAPPGVAEDTGRAPGTARDTVRRPGTPRDTAARADTLAGAALPAGTNTAAYLTIRNRSEESDRLVAATSNAARAVELHQTVEEDGMTRMRRVDGIDVQADESVRLEPGGLHLMLIDVNRRVVRGDSVELRLRFERAGEIEVRAEVRD
jgi:periplasmic copper chaperone A